MPSFECRRSDGDFESKMMNSKGNEPTGKCPDHEDEYFFEGAEKLLEIWWFARGANVEKGSLRKIPREKLDKMLDVAGCRILHSRHGDQLDSYVLSESSLFVADHRLILKTCGGTRLLDAIPHILSLAKRYASLESLSNVYYSRKNFIRPQLQPDPHKCFNDEVEVLSDYFPHGEAYCMGPLNSEDRWYLFVAMNEAQTAPTHSDHTLEIQMTHIPEDVLRVYSQESCSNGRECTRKSGISKLLPFGSVVHEELFSPIGYSMNGLVAKTDQYLTIHVTPERDFCYASFETNQRRQCLYKQTLQVLECFRPEKFVMTLFSNNQSQNGKNTQTQIWNDEIPGYHRLSLQFVRLGFDTLVYAQFARRNGGGLRFRELENIPQQDEEDDEDSNISSD